MRRSSSQFNVLLLLTAGVCFLAQLGMDYWFLRRNSMAGAGFPWWLTFQALVFLIFAAIIFLLLTWLVTRRLNWLVEEAGRIENGEEPRDPLGGGDAVSRLSAAMRRMALRKRDLSKALDEHSIVAITDKDGRITFVNDRFCQISGYAREELIGKTHRVINSGRHPAEFFKEMWRTISGSAVWRGDIENRARDGSHYFVATTIMPCLGLDGKPEQYIAIRTDITEQKATAARLELLTNELETKNRDLEVLIHAASHDLRTPLVNVQGFASVIREQLVPMKELFGEDPAETPSTFKGAVVIREIEESLGFICAGAEKMEALLKGLLVFSRLGRQKPELQILDAEKIVSQSLGASRFQIDEAEAEITVHSLPVCLGDPGLFGQIVSNLLDNALKYRDPARPLKLSISGSQQEALCVYRFQDNGIGIEPQHYERVFELFHRLNPRHSPGYGIGLAIVRRALDRMGGRVTVESVLNEGTVFSITLSSGSPGNGNLFAHN